MQKYKVLRAVKGFRGRSRNCIRLARNRYEKSLLHAYVGRKLKAREFRSLWITRINAATRHYQVTYGQFIHGLNQLQIGLNRKVLAQLAVTEPYTFRSIVEQVKQMTNLHSKVYPTYGLVHTELVVNPRVAVWNTHRSKQRKATTEFLTQYYQQKQKEAVESQTPSAQTSPNAPVVGSIAA